MGSLGPHYQELIERAADASKLHDPMRRIGNAIIGNTRKMDLPIDFNARRVNSITNDQRVLRLK